MKHNTCSTTVLRFITKLQYTWKKMYVQKYHIKHFLYKCLMSYFSTRIKQIHQTTILCKGTQASSCSFPMRFNLFFPFYSCDLIFSFSVHFILYFFGTYNAGKHLVSVLEGRKLVSSVYHTLYTTSRRHICIHSHGSMSMLISWRDLL